MNGSWLRDRARPAILGLIAVCLQGHVAWSAAADTQADSQTLDGTWKLVSIEAGGETKLIDDDVRLMIVKDKVLYGDEPLATLTSYPLATPRGIDLAFSDPKKDYEGIYALQGSQLRICLNIRTEGPKERPAEFATKDKSDLRVFVLERVASGEAAPERKRGFVGMALARENDAVIITDVISKSPAEKAGLRAGDVLLKIAGQPVTDLQAAVEMVRREAPGTELAIQLRREGADREIKVKVAMFPFSLLGLLG
jgi:uncharacterized protein (TIGR03067 family)